MTAPAHEAWQRAVRVVGRGVGLPQRAIREPEGGAARRARQLALYLAVTGFDLPARRVVDVVGVRLSTLQHALKRVEDQRDVPEIDEFIGRLEEALHA